MSTYRVNFLHCVFAIVTLLVSASAFGDSADLCGDAWAMEIDSTEQFFGDGETTDLVFSVEAPASGFLALDVLRPFTSPGAPQLLFLGDGCNVTGTGSAERLHEFIDGALIHVRAAGTYYFRVGGQDPSLPLDDLRIRAGFASHETAAVATKDETASGDEDQVDEILPLHVDCFPSSDISGDGRLATKDETASGDEDQVDEILPLRADCPSPDLNSLLASICRAHLADDVGDTFSCASVLKPGARYSGRIGNDRADDSDVFVMTLPYRTTLGIELAGETDLALAVYDRHGQVLSFGQANALGQAKALGGGETPFRSVRTFAPGTYFFEVEGIRGQEGDYTLLVEPRGW